MDRPQVALGSWAFSFGPFASAPWSVGRVLAFIAAAGYDGVEINGFRPHPHPADYSTEAQCRALVKQIEGYGLGISGYAPAFGAVPPAEVTTADYLAVFRQSLVFCSRCGIHTLRVDSVSPPAPLDPAEYAARFARLARTWHAAAAEAETQGVRLVWEFEPGFWLNKPSEVKRLAEAVDHANFKLLFDTSHAYMGAVAAARHTGAPERLSGGVAEYGRLLGPLIGHLHLIDSDGSLHNNETSSHTAFGQGQINFVEVLTALKPYVANLPWWCVDFCFNPDTPTVGREGAPFVRRLMDEVLP